MSIRRTFAVVSLMLGTLVACSSDDTGSTTSSSGSNSSSSSSGSSASTNTGPACTSITDCPTLKCTCAGFANADTRSCSNGKCAATREEASCK